jgi:hypothetical protein
MYLDASQKDNQIITRWRPPQLLELQITAMTIIGHMTTFMPEHILEIGSHMHLATFLKRYKDVERQKACMKALLSAANFDFFKVELQ